MTDFDDLNGVGPARSERLEDAGYTMKSLASAEAEDVAEDADVPEDTALEFIVQAQGVVDEEDTDQKNDEEESEGDVEELDEEDVDGDDTDDTTEDVEDAEESDAPETEVFELNLGGWEEQLLITALVDMHTGETFRRREKSKAAKEILKLMQDDVQHIELDRDKANALYYALHRKAQEYQGSNEVDMMNIMQDLRNRVNKIRESL